jgi:hypothetical protein
VHAHADGVLGERGGQSLDPLRDRGDLEREVAIDVGRRGYVADAFGGEPARVLKGHALIGCAVIHPRKQVEVEVDI